MVTINKIRRTDANRKFSVFSFQFSETLNRIRRTVANEVHSKIQQSTAPLLPPPLWGGPGRGLFLCCLQRE